jgi:hypothetical protein
MAARTKRGRRTSERYAPTRISLSSELRKHVDAWAARQSDRPARPEAILRLVELGLEATQHRGSLANRAAKASEMAAREIDRLINSSATHEEHQRRSAELLRDPENLELFASNRVKVDPANRHPHPSAYPDCLLDRREDVIAVSVSPNPKGERRCDRW